MARKVPLVLTIAGSDSGGGAGIQADLKTLNSLEVFGCSAITCVTAQNSREITNIHKLPNLSINKQITTVLRDFKIKYIKLGMLYDTETMKTVLSALQNFSNLKIISDPVMISKSGDSLLKDSSINFYIKKILPICYLITPNIHEANRITGLKIVKYADLINSLNIIKKYGAKNVLIKGGHSKDTNKSEDYLLSQNKIHKFASKRYDTKNTHGTGCTLSAAITGYLAKGFNLVESVRKSKKFVSYGIKNSLSIGKGHGPLDHFPRRKKYE